MSLNRKLAFSLLWLAIPLVQAQVTLTSARNLNLEQITAVAQQQEKVVLNQSAQDNIKAGFNTVMTAALNNKAVYGLTVGVGWNKDRPVFHDINGKRELAPQLVEMSKAFNLSSLQAHASGYGKPMATEVVRAAMLIRLNQMLNGETGVSEAVAQSYVNFLNHGITPYVPSSGSVGEADITLAAHIGLAMIGKGKVYYKGQWQDTSGVLKSLELKPLEPIGKDFLAILSNNALMAAQTVQLLQEAKHFYQNQISIFALMLQGLNGNVAPISHSATNARPFTAMNQVANDLNQQLQGSSLYQYNPQRKLQDPLSFRTNAYSLGLVKQAINELEQELLIQINHSDDNPIVLINGLDKQDNSDYMAHYYVDTDRKGVIVPTANFNFLPIAAKITQLNIALAKMAEVITQQTNRISEPEITKLSRFLTTPSNQGHAFGAIQKPYTMASYKIKQLAQPQLFDSVVLAGNIEDTATMSNLSLENSFDILDNLKVIVSYQLLHAAQAVDLRKDLKLSQASKKFYQSYRKEVPFLTQDQETTSLISTTKSFLE